MIKVCSEKSCAIQHLDISLAQDLDFVTTVLEKQILALPYVKPETVKIFPDLLSRELLQIFGRSSSWFFIIYNIARMVVWINLYLYFFIVV